VEQWFFRDPDRFRHERAALAVLLDSAKWLTSAEWNISEDGLCVDAVIHVQGHDYEVRLSYPALFPEVPLVVYPRNAQQRWSTHQYGGPDGPLCLEFGPDNWQPNITGVQMLESAHNLLEIENPHGAQRGQTPVIAPSRHRLTLGQEVRNTSGRWYYSAGFQTFLAGQQGPAGGSLKFSLRLPNETVMVLVHEAAKAGGEVWKDIQIPTHIPEAAADDLRSGAWFTASNHAGATSKDAKSLDALRAISLEAGHVAELLATDGTSPIAGFDRGIRGVVIIDRTQEPHFFLVFSDGDAMRCATIQSEAGAVERVKSSNSLSGKYVGIVGLGSAGSKIALTLARLGARRFYLVDHDIFLPENIVRNALDWQAVGEHKVDATTSALWQIAADMEVMVSRVNLTGQESNRSISTVLTRLGDCDLVVDATANPGVFNLLAASSKAARKPLVWLEVFQGGIGGFVARSRPELDPSAQIMRSAYLRYCEEQFKKAKLRYERRPGTDAILVVPSGLGVTGWRHQRGRFEFPNERPPRVRT
jgi:sulfur-carrier protein adenylyltransferase/sulfurtransferase